MNRHSMYPVSTTAPEIRTSVKRRGTHPNAKRASRGSGQLWPRMTAIATRKMAAVARPGRKSWASRYSSVSESPGRVWVSQPMMSVMPVKPRRMWLPFVVAEDSWCSPTS